MRITVIDLLDRAMNGDKNAARIAKEKFPFLSLGCDGLPAKVRHLVDEDEKPAATPEWYCAKAALEGRDCDYNYRFEKGGSRGGQPTGWIGFKSGIVRYSKPMYRGGIPDGTKNEEWDLVPLRNDVIDL